MSSAGCLSQEEFLALQEQLLTLRNQNYELQDSLRKLKIENTNSSPKNEAILFASKLINRNKDKDVQQQKYEAEIVSLRTKLETQEEEFRLQQQTLFSELKQLTTQNAEFKDLLGNAACDESVSSKAQLFRLENDMKEIQQKYEEMSNEANGCKKEIVEKEVLIRALEDQLLEYKEKSDYCFPTLVYKTKFRKTTALRKLEEHEVFLASLQEELSVRDQKEVTFSSEIASLKTLVDKTESECLSFKAAINHCEKENKECKNELDELKKQLTAYELKNTELTEELNQTKKALINLESKQNELKSIINAKDSDIDDLRMKLLSMEEENQERQTQLKKAFEEQKHKIELDHQNSLNENQNAMNDLKMTEEKLKAEMNTFELETRKDMDEKMLLLETRYQLEISDQQKQFELAKEQLSSRIINLEETLKGKDEDKTLALKKQSALLKELQRALKEEKKRSDSLEKGKGERDGWQVVDSDQRSNHTFDGNESVSSVSALESDNAELINRLTSMHRVYSDSTEKVILLESENSRLQREITEKNELIENWIKNRPISIPSTSTNQKQDGVFRKLLTSLPVNDSANDMKEMNKKLQRMLEETLSKNIILQRDLQTLLERTEM